MTQNPTIDLKAEKAASAARKAKALAAAEVEFEAWYQDLGTRAGKSTGGYAGANRGRVLTTSAKCWCGKATAALGLCENHYSQFWRKKNVSLGLRDRIALCHPDRSHYRKGFCRECFAPQASRETKFFKIQRTEREFLLSLVPVPRRRSVPGKRKAWKCAHTDRDHYGYGICAPCCKKREKLLRGETRSTRRLLVDFTICGHDSLGKPITNGYCQRCYRRELMRKTRRKQRGRRKPLRLPHNPPIYCVHPDRKHHAKHCCKTCYYAGKWKQPGFLLGIAA